MFFAPEPMDRRCNGRRPQPRIGISDRIGIHPGSVDPGSGIGIWPRNLDRNLLQGPGSKSPPWTELVNLELHLGLHPGIRIEIRALDRNLLPIRVGRPGSAGSARNGHCLDQPLLEELPAGPSREAREEFGRSNALAGIWADRGRV